MAKKAADAFRTISEVSETLDTPAHVLRFWESKFKQIKPVKRAGGRRYYRPEDIDLLCGIKSLLHEQGMTIKGAQKLLREKGVKYVSDLAPISGAAKTTAPKQPKAAKDVIDAKPVAVKFEDTKDEAPVQANLTGTPILEADLPSLDLKESQASPGFLSVLTKKSPAALSRKADAIAPIYAKLSALHERMRPA